MSVPELVAARRSIRAFTDEPVPRELLDMLVESACLAPAPHHSRPWRFVVVDTPAAKQALADGMGDRWRTDLEGDGVTPATIDDLVARSHAKLTAAPALVLGCLTGDGLDRYPDETRQRAEWGMALLSLGAAVENLMLAATDAGLASCWVAAPIFCPEAARDALTLDVPWLPQALVLLGYPSPATPQGNARASRWSTSARIADDARASEAVAGAVGARRSRARRSSTVSGPRAPRTARAQRAPSPASAGTTRAFSAGRLRAWSTAPTPGGSRPGPGRARNGAARRCARAGRAPGP